MGIAQLVDTDRNVNLINNNRITRNENTTRWYRMITTAAREH
jgi:hypothetical protein